MRPHSESRAARSEKARHMAKHAVGAQRTRRKLSDLRVFDAAEFLTDEETIAAYLDISAKESDSRAIEEARATVERARARNAARAES